MARRRTSYAWARHLDPSEVPAEVYEGYSYARLLAENNREWSRQALRRGAKPFPLTAEQLGEVQRVSGATTRARIAEARYALYGRLSDGGIYYRRAQAKRRRERGERRCRAPDCENLIPENAPAHRRYCRPACKRRHHYHRPGLAARAEAAIAEWEAEVVRERLREIREVYARACTRSSAELHELVEHARLSAACPGFLALAAADERGALCAFAYGRRSEGDHWWWQAPLARELRRKKKPRRWPRGAYVIGELAVAPEQQGRGLGRALLERLLARREAAGAAAVVVVLDAAAASAADFYRTLGFADLLADFRLSPEGAPKRIMLLASDAAVTPRRGRAAAPTRSSRARRSGA